MSNVPIAHSGQPSILMRLSLFAAGWRNAAVCRVGLQQPPEIRSGISQENQGQKTAQQTFGKGNNFSLPNLYTHIFFYVTTHVCEIVKLSRRTIQKKQSIKKEEMGVKKGGIVASSGHPTVYLQRHSWHLSSSLLGVQGPALHTYFLTPCKSNMFQKHVLIACMERVPLGVCLPTGNGTDKCMYSRH